MNKKQYVMYILRWLARNVLYSGQGIEGQCKMNNQTLRMENMAFGGTRGVSENNTGAGYLPAFRDSRTGRVEIARTRVGLPAPCHMIEWLPREWARTLTDSGRVSSLRPEIVSGFVRDGVFYTREELASL